MYRLDDPEFCRDIHVGCYEEYAVSSISHCLANIANSLSLIPRLRAPHHCAVLIWETLIGLNEERLLLTYGAGIHKGRLQEISSWFTFLKDLAVYTRSTSSLRIVTAGTSLKQYAARRS